MPPGQLIIIDALNTATLHIYRRDGPPGQSVIDGCLEYQYTPYIYIYIYIYIYMREINPLVN